MKLSDAGGIFIPEDKGITSFSC